MGVRRDVAFVHSTGTSPQDKPVREDGRGSALVATSSRQRERLWTLSRAGLPAVDAGG